MRPLHPTNSTCPWTLWRHVALALVVCAHFPGCTSKSDSSTNGNASGNAVDYTSGIYGTHNIHSDICIGVTPPDSAWPAQGSVTTETSFDIRVPSDTHDGVETLDSANTDASVDTAAVDVMVRVETDQPVMPEADVASDTSESSGDALESSDMFTAPERADIISQNDAGNSGDASHNDDIPLFDAAVVEEDTIVEAQDIATTDDGDGIIEEDVVAAADSAIKDIPCEQSQPETGFGSAAPQWSALDFQPQSCGYGASYGLDLFKGHITVVALLAAW